MESELVIAARKSSRKKIDEKTCPPGALL